MERKLRRSRLVNALLALVLFGVVALAGWAFAEQRKAARALCCGDSPGLPHRRIFPEPVVRAILEHLSRAGGRI